MGQIIIQNFRNPDGLPNAKIIYDNKAITLHSFYPFKEAEKIVKNFNKNLRWVLIVGFGYGYIVEYLLNNTNYNILIYENINEIIEHSKKVRNIENILNNKRVNLITGDIKNIFDFLDNNSIRELNYYIHRPYITLFNEELKNLDGMLIAYLTKKNINKFTLKRFQRVWLRNIIKNSYFYFSLPGLNDIEHNFKDYPAIVVGAGPSLEKNIELLYKIQNKAIIISTDTALPMLNEYEIIPDFVVSVDPQDKNSLYLMYSKNKNSFLVADSACSYLTFLKYNKDKTIIYDSIFPAYNELTKFWGNKGRIICGGSVSTAAFDLCRFFKCNPIILIGQDLAFSKKHTHFKRTILEFFLYFKTNRFKTYDNYHSSTLVMSDNIEIKGFFGDKVQTDRKFLTFLDWFRKEGKYTNSILINATEGGAYIDGFIHISLNDVYEKYLKNNPDKNTKYIKINHNKKSDDEFISELNSIYDKIKKLLNLSYIAFESSEKALANFNKNLQIDKYINKMNEFDIYLLNLIKEKPIISRLLELTCQDSIDLLIESSDYNNINLELLEIWNKLYKEIYNGLLFLLNLIDKRINIGKV